MKYLEKSYLTIFVTEKKPTLAHALLPVKNRRKRYHFMFDPLLLISDSNNDFRYKLKKKKSRNKYHPFFPFLSLYIWNLITKLCLPETGQVFAPH